MDKEEIPQTFISNLFIRDFIKYSKEDQNIKNDKIDALQWRLHKAYERISDLEKLVEELSK